MNIRFKAAVIFAAAMLILGTPVFAQEIEVESNTSKATAGVFTNEVDDSMSVIDYSGVEFDKWFGFIGYGGYDPDPLYNAPIQLGYATRLGGSEGEDGAKSGGLYLGLFYTGNVMEIDENWNETVTTTYDPFTQLKTNIASRTEYTDYNRISSRNQLSVLVGAADMGFKFGFYERVTQTTNPNRTIETTDALTGEISHTTGDIVDYKNVSGILFPTLTWGTSFDAGSIVIKPEVRFGLGIGLDSEVNNFRIGAAGYTTINGEVSGADTIYYYGYEGKYVRPDIQVGAAIDFENFSLDFSYGLGTNVYSNSYDGSGFSGKVKGTVEWYGNTTTTSSIATTQIDKTTDLSIEENTTFDHSISLGFYKDKEVAEGLKLGIYAGADIGIGITNTDSYGLSLTRNEVNQNNDALSSLNTRTENEVREFTTTEKVTEFELHPFVNLGASYALFPGRFTINAGIALSPFGFSSTISRASGTGQITPGANPGDPPDWVPATTTTTREYDANGNVTSESVTVDNAGQTADGVEVKNTLNYLSAGLSAGFVFNFTEKLFLDLTVHSVFSSSGTSTFELEAANVNVLLGFKF